MSHSPSPAVDNLAGEPLLPTRAMLIVLLVGASFAFSMAFACATPFAALAAVAVLRMKRVDAFVAVTLAWLVNQADGFLFMHYPRTLDTVGWGIAIWLAALTAAFSASAVSRFASRVPLAASAAALGASFVAYEAVLLAVTLVLPSSGAAFYPAVVGRMLAINAFAFALLLALVGVLRIAASTLSTSTRSGGAKQTMAPKPVKIER